MILILFNIIVCSTSIIGRGISKILSNVFAVVCSFIAVLGLFTAINSFRKFDSTKLCWGLLFIGILFYFFAEAIYAVLEVVLGIDMEVMFPSWADYFWLIGYIPLVIGMAIMIYWYKKSSFPLGNIRFYQLLIFLFIISVIVLFYTLLIPIAKDIQLSLAARFVYIFYPAADLLLLIEAVILIYIISLFGGGIISKPWKYISIGFTLITLADIFYSYLNWHGKYGTGNIIDVAWNLGYLLIGLAGIYQKELMESFRKIEINSGVQ